MMVLIIASGKGGVGKTVFTSNLGTALANMGYRVALIDMNIGLRNLDLYMGLESRVIYDVTDVITGICPLRRALVKDKRFPCLSLLAAPQDIDKFCANEEDMAKLYEELGQKFDFVLVDGPAGLHGELRLAAKGADMGVIVTTMENVSLRDADMADRLLIDVGVLRRAYVINKVNRDLMQSGCMPSFEDVAQRVRLPLLGIVQYDDNIQIAANRGCPLAAEKGNYVEENFSKIAERLIGESGLTVSAVSSR